MIVLVKKSFVISSTIIVSTSIHIKCMSLSNQKYMTQPTLINLHPNGYSQELHIICLRLIKVDVLEVEILLMAYLVKHVFQMKQKI